MLYLLWGAPEKGYIHIAFLGSSPNWTLFFFHAMFRDPEPLGRQIDDLASLRQVCWLGTQIVLATLAADDVMIEDLIGHLYLLLVMPTMAHLARQATSRSFSASSWGDEQSD